MVGLCRSMKIKKMLIKHMDFKSSHMDSQVVPQSLVSRVKMLKIEHKQDNSQIMLRRGNVFRQ